MSATPYPINESLGELDMIREQRGPEVAARIDMLLLFKSRKATTIADAAGLLHISERTLRRWCRWYREGGLTALVDRNSTRLAGESAGPVPIDSPAPALPSRLMDFLNSLPNVFDNTAWIEQFRAGLIRLLGDVDRMTVNVNINARSASQEVVAPGLTVTLHLKSSARANAREVATSRAPVTSGGGIVWEMMEQGFPADLYHPPHTFDYHHSNGSYLGSIILWREHRHRPVSQATLATLLCLEPFMRFMLADCIARHQAEHPEQRVVADRIMAVAREARLTLRQREVLVLRLSGKTYPEIADDLGVAVTTVHKHVEAIHRKTGVRTLEELFALCLMPLRAHM